jgi:hypothetical protein
MGFYISIGKAGFAAREGVKYSLEDLVRAHK